MGKFLQTIFVLLLTLTAAGCGDGTRRTDSAPSPSTGTTASPDTTASDHTLAAPLCGVLKKLLPEVRTYTPEGAQAQLVMAVAEAFDYDAAKLRRVKAEIDQVTSASCPKDRESMLAILKMKSLAEAVR